MAFSTGIGVGTGIGAETGPAPDQPENNIPTPILVQMQPIKMPPPVDVNPENYSCQIDR